MLIDTMQAVVGILNSRGFSASLEYPGFVCVRLGTNETANFGTVNGPWGGDITDTDGAYSQGLTMPKQIQGDSTNAEAIAAAIEETLAGIASDN